MEPPSFPAAALQTVRAAPGSAASFCLPLPTGTPPFLYTWSRAGASLDDRFTTSDDAGGIRLTVSTARTGDSGVYTLQASNAAGSDTTKVRLEVSADEAPTGEDPPTFLRRLQDLTVKVGTRTRFLVEILSSTECKVTWYRNERRLMEAERVALARDGNFWCADVAAVSVDDAGRWTCTAENIGGRASCSAHLNVLVPKAYKRPEFVEELRALLTEQGTVSLECKVVGVPTPLLRWFKDSCEIKAGDVFALTANAEDPTSLGTYTCEAVNCMGRAYSSSKVHVVGHGSREGSAKPSSSGVIPEPPPIFTKELEDRAVKICEPIALNCQLVVPPWPRSVLWYNKEGKVEPGERYHVMEDGVGGYLMEVVSAEWQDEGEWKCVATSSGGRVGISTCFVTMDVPKNYRKPRFMENLQAVLTEEGLVSFECKVVGFPTPVLSWFKDGQELKPGDVYQLTGTNSLGSYCCIARNCMGQASSSAELTVEDIQNQLNEEEKLQLFSKNQAPKFIQGLKSVEVKIDEPFRFTIKVAIPPEPSVLWYRDDQPVDESNRCHHGKEERGVFYLDIQNLEFLDQAEWKCVAINDFGHSVTSCFLKLIIPRHYKKPRFLENLQAILSEEGAVNLECKVIGVPQPVLKWYKDGEELKPGDIHRIISGQDGTCCLGTYTCEAQNCMGIAASSASLLGFDDSMKAKKKKAEEQALQRNLSLSTIHEERTSQMYDTPVGDITEDKGEISFSFDGKEVSVSLYETPDLTEEEALQIVEMYADQLSENVTEHNVVELPPLRFVKETSTSGNLLMEAIIIDVSPEYFPSHEEDLRTEADVDDISIAEENGPPNLSLDQDIDIVGEDYLEKTIALLSEEKAYKFTRKKSDSQKSVDDYFSLSREHSLSEEKRDDDTHGISESDLQSFASAKSLEKPKSKSPKLPGEDGQESSEPTKTILIKDEVKIINEDSKSRKERRSSRSRRSSSESDKCQNRPKQDVGNNQEEVIKAVISNNEFIECGQNIHMIHNENVKALLDHVELKQEKNMDESTELAESIIMSKLKANEPQIICEEFKNSMLNMSKLLTQVINDIEIIEKDIILKSELMSSAATASKSLEIISSLIAPLSEIISISDAAKESAEAKEVTSSLFNSLPQPLKALQRSLTIVEKCIDVESDNKTLVKKTCVAFIEKCGENIQKLVSEIKSETSKNYLTLDSNIIKEIITVNNEIDTVIKLSTDTIRTKELLTEANKIKDETIEAKHLKETQKNVFYLKTAINSLLYIIKSADIDNIEVSSKVKVTDIILNNMSVAIHDLQTALEQIENLSVKESNLSLPNYNNEIINSVMDPVLKLRSSFEQLSTEVPYDDKPVLKETSKAIQINLNHVATHINRIENEIGKFDILESENKLDVLQKMAQILINLENNLPRLEIMPQVKISMIAFHKNLTRILENVIESNDGKKYCELMEICDAINRVNTSIKCIDTDNILSLVSISNNLRIIQNKCNSDVFESKLNGSLLTTITDILIGIQETINKAEEVTMSYNSDHVQEIPCDVYDISKSNTVIEQINRTMASIDIVKSLDSASYFKKTFIPVLENISPILEEIKTSIACATGSAAQDESVSDILSFSFAETLANPLCELNQNIVILNQIIIENTESIKDNTEILSTFAKPLHELHKTLEILQQDIVSQYTENLTPYEVSANIASAVNNLQSCIVIVQAQAGVEGTNEMSTLEDISGIKTTAETIVSDRFVAPSAEVIVPELHIAEFEAAGPKTAAADALQMLNEHLSVLQNPEIIEALETLSEVSELSSLKSVIIGLGELHTGIEEILHPVVFDNSDDIFNLVNSSKLLAIAEPMQDIQQHLSVLDTNTITIYENVLKISPEKVGAMVEKIRVFQDHLYKCMQAIFPALETVENTIEISNKIGTLRVVCKHLKDVIESTNVKKSNSQGFMETRGLINAIDNLLEATDVRKGIRIDQVKYRTEELYEKITTVQEELIQFTPQSPSKLAEEVQLIEIIHEVEKNIAILEQYEFIELSRASDLTSCASSHVAMELETLSLMKIDDLAENAVHVIQDSVQETPLVDLLIVEDFFTTCKNEFSLLRCLASKYLTYKRIIRLLQEFNVLKNTVDEFKLKKMELNLSDNINACLTNFLDHADECINITKTSLIKIIDEKSDMLFHTSFCKIDSTYDNFNQIIDDINDTDLKEVLVHFIEIVNVAKPCIKSAKIDILDELKGARLPCRSTNSKLLADRVEAFVTLIENKIITSNIDTKLKLQNVLKCIQKHSGYRDAMGTSQVMILLKGLTECADVLQNKSLCVDFTEQVATPDKIGNELQTALNEMLEPLQFVRNQIKDIQKQILSGIDEESISVDVTITKSLVDTMTQINQDIVDKIDALPLDSEDFSLASEVDIEIQSIQDSLKAVDNIEVVQSLKELLKPLEEVERTLQKVLTPQNIISENKESLTTDINANSGSLEQAIENFISLEKYISFLKFIDKVDIKKCLSIAIEINILHKVSNNEILAEAKEKQKQNMNLLKEKLLKCDWVNTEKYLEGKNEKEAEILKDIFLKIYQLVAELDKETCIVKERPENAKLLIQHIDQYIELIEVVEEISAVIKIENLKEVVEIAKELRESISIEGEIYRAEDIKSEITAHQFRLANNLQKALTTLQVQIFDSAQELAPGLYDEVLQRITKVTEQLQANLVAVTGIHIAIQAPFTLDKRLKNDALIKNTDITSDEISSVKLIDMKVEANEDESDKIATRKLIVEGQLLDNYLSENSEMKDTKANNDLNEKNEENQRTEKSLSTQSNESCKTNDETTVKMKSKELITETVMPSEEVSDSSKEIPIGKSNVILEVNVSDVIRLEAREVASSAEVITEQTLDIQGEVFGAQVSDLRETKEEDTVNVESNEVITAAMMPSEKTSELTEEIPIAKADVMLEAGVDDMLNSVAKEVVNFAEVITEQPVDIQGEVVGAQVSDLRETKEEDTVNVESNEVITAAMMPSEKTSELTEEVPIAKADVMLEAGVDDMLKSVAKEVVSSAEVITEQAVDIQGEVIRAQATESCETRAEGTVKVESKEVITESMMPSEKALELTEEVPIAKADVMLEAGVDDMLKSVAKEVVSSTEVITEQTVDIEGEMVRVQATESCETRDEGTVKVESKEVITEAVMPSEKALELTEEVPIAKADVKSEASVEDVIKLEAKEVVNSTEVITEQTVDIEGEMVRVQATESCETRDEGTVKVESKEVITEAVMSSEKALELTEEVPITTADVMLEAGVEDVKKLEAKEVVRSTEVITEQTVDIEKEMVRAQATESCETRAEGTVKVESKEVITEAVMHSEKALELIEDVPIAKADVKSEASVEDVIKLEAKEVISSAEVITEQTVDIEGEMVRVQATESCETRDEGTVKVESKEVITEAVMPSEKALKLTEEVPITKADVMLEAGVEDVTKLEAKEVVSSAEVITEQPVDIQGEVVGAQVSDLRETKEEDTVNVESNEVITAAMMLSEKTSELTEEIPIAKADVMLEAGVDDMLKSVAKEVVSSAEVITAQAVDIQGEVIRAQATESCETRAEGTVKVESKEVITESMMPSEKALELTEEVPIAKADVKSEASVEDVIKLEAKEVVNSTEVITEQTVDIEGEMVRVQATESCETRDEGTVKVESKEVITEAVMSSEKALELTEEVPITKADVMLEAGVEDVTKLEAKEVVRSTEVITEQTVDIEKEMVRAQATESCEARAEGTVKVESKEVITEAVMHSEKALELIEDVPIAKADVKSEASVEDVIKLEAKEVVSTAEVITEQPVAIQGEVVGAQVSNLRETKEEDTVNVESNEVITAAMMLSEKTSELTEEIPIAKADVMLEAGVDDMLKSVAKEVVSSAEVITAQAVDIQGEVIRAQATESCETRAEGTVKVESKEVITESMMPSEKALELTEEVPIAKADVKSEASVEDVIKLEAKEVVSSTEVITEQTVDIEGEMFRVQATESCETRDEGTVKVESKEVITEAVMSSEKALELTEEVPITKADVMLEAGVEDVTKLEAKEVVRSTEVITEQTVDIEKEMVRAQATESCETRAEGTVMVESKEVITEAVMHSEKALELIEDVPIAKADVKSEARVDNVIKLEAKEVVSTAEVITEQTVDIHGEVVRAQATESCEIRAECTVKVESEEVISEGVIVSEKALELTEEVPIAKADVKSEASVEDVIKLEAKEVVSSAEVITEQPVDIQGEVVRAQAFESCETRDEGTVKVESKEVITEAVMPSEKALELTEEVPIAKADVKSEASVEDVIKLEAKEVVSSAEVITEQAVDIEGEGVRAQATESCETRAEGTVKIESKEVITEAVMHSEKSLELTEEVPIAKADVKSEASVEDVIKLEVKEVVSSTGVIIEQTIDIEREGVRAQATESYETRDEVTVNVESKEVITEAVMPSEKALELTEEVPIPKADIMLEASVEDVIKLEAKEVVSTAEVITEQTVDIQGEVVRAQATELCEARADGTVKVESKDVITEGVIVSEKASEFVEEIPIGKANLIPEAGDEDVTKLEAKEIVSSAEIITEQTLDIEGKVVEVQAIESREIREEGTVQMETKEVITEAVMLSEKVSESVEEIPIVKTDVITEAGVKDIIKLEVNEVMTSKVATTEETLDIEREVIETQNSDSYGTREEDKARTESMKVNIDGISDFVGTGEQADVKSETNNNETIKSEATEVISSEPVHKIVGTKDLGTTVKDVVITHKQDIKVGPLTDFEVVQETETVVNVNIPKENVAVIEDATPVLFEEIAINDKNELIPVKAGETVEGLMAKAVIDYGGIIQHIEDFVASDIVDIVDGISNLTHVDELKETVEEAKELRKCILASDILILEEAVPLNEMMAQQARLAEKLQYSLSLLHTKTLESSQELAPVIKSENLQRISEIITHLQDDLERVIVSAPIVVEEESTYLFKEQEEDALKHLDLLLKEVNTVIDVTDKNESESLKDTLNEVQTVIIKLKKEFDGAGDILNETLDDLECSVRSVQLQINEDMPQELLKEACATLKLFANNLHDTKNQNSTLEINKESSANILENCLNKTEISLKLLEKAAKIKVSDLGTLKNAVSCLKSLTESLKMLRESFTGDADILIDNGVEVIQSLNLLEDKLFSIERDINTETSLKVNVKDNIKTAITSVYSSISHMRSTISSIQKRYMFDNYGKPSQLILRSIKKLTSSANLDEEKKISCKKLSKSLRGLLNHFEDIKFYINLDKTARLPSDAAFTKVLLKELESNICEVTSQSITRDSKIVKTTLQCVEKNLKSIETQSTVEVKTKIPIFKEIAIHVFNMTESLKVGLQSECSEIELNKETYIISTLAEKPTESDLKINIVPKISQTECTEEMLAVKTKDGTVKSTDASVLRTTSGSERVNEFEPLNSVAVINKVDDKPQNIANAQNTMSVNNTDPETVIIVDKSIDSTAKTDTAIIALELDKDKQLDTVSHKHEASGLSINITIGLDNADIEKPSTSSGQENALDNLKEISLNEIQNYNKHESDLVDQHPKEEIKQHGVSRMTQSGQVSELEESTNITVENVELSNSNKKNIEIEQILERENQTEEQIELEPETNLKPETILIEKDLKSPNEKQKIEQMLDKDSDIDSQNKNEKDTNKDERMHVIVDETEKSSNLNQSEKKVKSSEKIVIPKRLEKQQQKPTEQENISQNKEEEIEGKKIDVQKEKSNEKKGETKKKKVVKDKDKKKLEVVDKQELDDEKMKQKEVEIKKEQAKTDMLGIEMKNLKAEKVENIENKKLTDNKPKLDEETKLNKDKEDGLVRQFEKEEKSEEEDKIQKEKEVSDSNKVEVTDLSKEIANKNKGKTETKKKKTAKDKENNSLKENEHKELEEVKLIQEEESKTVKGKALEAASKKIETEQDGEAENKKNKKLIEKTESEFQKVKEEKAEVKQSQEENKQLTVEEVKIQKNNEINGKEKLEQEKIKEEENKTTKENEAVKKRKSSKDNRKDEKSSKNNFGKINPKQTEEKDTKKEKEKYELQKLEADSEKQIMDRLETVENKKDEILKHKDEELKKEKENTENCRLGVERIKESKTQKEVNESETRKLEEKEQYKQEAMTNKDTENIKKTKTFKDKEKKEQEESVNQNLEQNKLKQEKEAKIKTEKQKLKNKKSITQNKELEEDVAKLHVKINSQNKEDQMSEDKTYAKGNNLTTHEAKNTLAETESHKSKDNELQQEEESKLKKEKIKIDATHSGEEQKKLTDEEAKTCIRQEETKRKMVEVLQERLQQRDDKTNDDKVDINKQLIKEQEEADKKKEKNEKLNQEKETETRKEEVEVKELEVIKKTDDTEKVEEPVKSKLVENKLKLKETAKVNEGGDVKQTEEEKNKIKEELIAQAKLGECNKIYQQVEDSKVTKEKEEANNKKLLKSKEKKLRQETKKNTLEGNKHKQEKQTIIKEDATETVKTEPENKRLEVQNLEQDEEAKLIKVIKDAAPYRVEQEKKQHENNDRLRDKKEKNPDKVNTREEGANATKLKEMYNELQAENRFEIKQEISGDRNAELHTEGNISDTGEHYIREYQYEPHKKDKRDVPRFVDHNYKDYSMDFAHPPGYREKTFDSSINTHDNLGLGKNASIHKVQTIILESQLRNSTSPYLEREESRKEREEWRSESRRSKASSEGRSMASEKRAVTRDLKRKPVFSTYLTDRTAVEGSRVKLTCSVLSSTDPSITWYKNGIIIDSQLKYRTKFIDGLITLEVLNAVPSDSAEYSCTVENENGSVSSSANLKVYPSFEASPIPPTFTRSIRDTYHLAENELVLECRIRGQPLPSITWLKDDKPIPTNERYQAYYLADGVCRLAIDRPTHEDSGKYTCKAENAAWSDHINHVVHFTGKESRLSPNLATTERTRFNRQAMESRRPHFTNVLSDYKVVKGGTIGLQVEIRGAPTHVEWLREGRSVTEIYRNARTFVEQGLYTLALSDVTEKESGLYTCRAWNNQENVDMNAAITVVPPNEKDGKPATIVGRPEKDILISVGEDINISFRMQGEPKPKVVFMKGIRDITTNQRVCKMTSDDYVKFTLKRSTISDAGTYCILVRNAYGCDRAFVTVVIRQRASSNNLISDWTYPRDDTALSITQRKYKSSEASSEKSITAVPDRIPAEPTVVDGGSNWVSIAWPKPSYGASAPVLAYKVENWLMGKEGGARWVELGITPLNSFDAFNLKQGEEYHFRITPRNRYGFGESVQTSTPIGIGLAGDRPEFVDILPGQLKVLASETANLTCSVKGRPVPEVTWMKNGHEIEDDDRMKASFNGFNCCLTIDNINNEDEGRYSCEASNIHGSASTYARLTVVTDRLVWEADAKLKRERSAGVEGEYPPQFTMRLRDRRVQATYPVRLTCQVVGNPSPTVTWFKDAVEITLDSRHGTYQDEHFHTLEIAPTTVEDGGIYEVMARNTCGAVSCRCGLVVDKGIRAYVAPEFCCGLEPLYTLNEGEELRISAVVEAYPSVGVIWYRNGVRLRPSRRAVMTLDRDGQIELALASVTHRDAGVYSCVASNEVGRACTSGKVQVLGGETTAKRVLPVVISPDIPYSKEPMFIRKPRSSEAREGDTVIIACEVVGDPKPDVYWLRDFLKPDYYRDSSHFKRIGEGPEYRFEIPHAKLDYTGAYSVVARNIHGETKAIISLQIKARDPTCSEDHNIRYGRVDVIPRFDRNLTDLLSCDGDTVEFECRVSGDPEPDIRWFHYTELIRACSDFETSYEESAARLKIKHVTAEDEGTYTCEASNNLGKATSSACLVVYPPGEPNTLSQRLRRPPALLSAASTPHSTPRSTPARSVSRTPGPESRRVCSPSRTVAPTFYTYPYNKVVEEGENVVFKCAVKGMPLPWATWDKDGVIITSTSRITIREKDDMLRILEIEQVSIEDVGVYRITVENEFGRAEASARLEVISKSGKFYAGVRAYSASPRKSFPYRLRASTSKD